MKFKKGKYPTKHERITYAPAESEGVMGEHSGKEKGSIKKCVIHQVPMEGLNYICPKCNSIYCLVCIKNLLLSTEKCIVCDEPVLKDENFELLKHQLEPGARSADKVLKKSVTRKS